MNAPGRPAFEAAQGFIGRPMRRSEDERFLTGAGCYVGDFKLEGLLHAAILRSTHAHALIRRIDATRALALRGVAGFFTYRDIAPVSGPIPIRLAPLPGLERFRQEPLAQDRVRYVGEAIGIVVASSRYVAEDALDLIEVEYEPLPVMVRMEEALRDASVLHPAAGTNLASRYSVSKGDAARAFAAADYTRRETFTVHRHSAIMMETRGLVAAFDARTQRLTVWGATKVPFFNRRALAQMLRLPESDVELVELDVGGGFGVRGEFYREDLLVPFAAMKTARPVKWIEDRREHFLACNHSREMACELEVAFRRDGTLLAMRGRIRGDIGAYVRTAACVGNAKAAQFLPGPYRLIDFECEVESILTNKTPVGTYRGPGRYEANFFRERMFDLAAADLGLDPAELRARNLIGPQEMPYDIGRLCPYEGQNLYDSGDYPSAFRQALERFDYSAAAAQSGRLIDGRYHGLGICCFVESSGAGPSESTRIVVRDGAAVDVYTGCTSMGQGHETVLAQIAADALELPFEAIRIFHGSTSYVEDGFGTYHSRAIVMGGSSIHVAAQKLIAQWIGLAAELHGLPAGELAYRSGAVWHGASDRLLLSVESLAARAQAGEPKARSALEVSAKFEVSARTFTYGTHIAHVAVDPLTAQVEVIRYLGVEDVGRAVNPLLVDAQSIGGSVQGIGGTLLEEFVYDDEGQLLSASLADYLLPTACDYPNVEALTLEEAPSRLNPLGVKGAGEGAIGCAGAAIGNAVAAALRGLGVRVNALPLSPDKVAGLLREARAAGPQGAL